MSYPAFIVLADEFNGDVGDSPFLIEFRVDGVEPIAVAGGYDDTETGMAQVVVELLADGVLLVLVEDVAERLPVLANGLGGRIGMQDVAGIADPAEAGIDADLADVFADELI